MGLIPVRNRLVYPGGSPGVNPSHPASQNLILSAISGVYAPVSSVSFQSLTGKPIVITGGSGNINAIPVIDPIIGPSTYNNAASIKNQGIIGPNTTPPAVTIALILTLKTVGANNIYQNLTTYSGSSSGLWLKSNGTSGVPVFYTITDHLAAFSLLTGHSYFIAISCASPITSAAAINFVARDLRTGQIFSSAMGVIAGTANGDGTVLIGEDSNEPSLSAIAATMYARTFLTMPQLLQWADDPWPFWYQNQFDLAQAIQTSAAPVVVDSGQPLLTKTPLKPMARRFPLFNFDLPQPSGVSGTLAATETTDTAAFAGDVVISATLAATETTDTAAFAGSVIVSGTLAATETTDTAAFAGAVGTSGTLAATEAQDIAAFNGSVIVSGTLVATEATDTAAFNGSVVVSGTLAATEGVDTANFNGAVGTSGSLAATEAKDIAAFAGDVKISATLAATEATDVAAFVGSVVVSGTLAATEAKDVAAFAGSVIVSGTLAATETTDTAAFAGTVVTGIGVILAATETTDTAAFVGNVRINAALAATETQDIAAFAGFPFISGVSGTLAANELADTARISGLLDTIAILGQPGDLNFGIPNVFVRTLRW